MPNIEQEVLALEHEYWDSMISKDGAVASRLTGETSIITGAQGVSTVSRATIGEMVNSEGWKLNRYEFSDVTVVSPTPETAVIAYHVVEDLEVGGQSLTLEANDATLWVRRNEGWVSVLHTESVAGDPFGRDRKDSDG